MTNDKNKDQVSSLEGTDMVFVVIVLSYTAVYPCTKRPESSYAPVPTIHG